MSIGLPEEVCGTETQLSRASVEPSEAPQQLMFVASAILRRGHQPRHSGTRRVRQPLRNRVGRDLWLAPAKISHRKQIFYASPEFAHIGFLRWKDPKALHASKRFDNPPAPSFQ